MSLSLAQKAEKPPAVPVLLRLARYFT